MSIDDRLIRVFFVTRRYPGFKNSSEFLSYFENQYFWIHWQGKRAIEASFIFGSDINMKIDHDLGKIFLVKDAVRSSPLSHSISFYKNGANIVNEAEPDIVHYQGLSDIVSHWLFNKKVARKTKGLIQDHASVYKPKYRKFSSLFKKFDGFLFHSVGQEAGWVQSNTLIGDKIYFVPEGTTQFVPNQSERLKRNDNIKKLLWVGNLDGNKDPLTILNAVNELSGAGYSIHLSMIYRHAPLINEVILYIRENGLEKMVDLIGEVNHKELEDYYNQAHYFVLGSAKEGSGYSVIESMACGVIPILSNIPSFIEFTKQGEIGALFERGSRSDLVSKLKLVLSRPIGQEREKVLDYYNKKFSPTALATRCTEVYTQIMSKTK